MKSLIRADITALTGSGKQIVDCSTRFSERIKYIYDKIEELSHTAFVGSEMQSAYLPKMNSYLPILNKLKEAIAAYGDFMIGAANKYSAVQEQARMRAEDL